MAFDMTKEQMHVQWANMGLPEESFADLERMTAAIRAADDAMDNQVSTGQRSFEDLAAELWHVHPEAVRHCSEQRAMRLLNIKEWPDVSDEFRMKFIATMMAMWVDGMNVGLNAFPRMGMEFSVIDGSIRSKP